MPRSIVPKHWIDRRPRVRARRILISRGTTPDRLGRPYRPFLPALLGWLCVVSVSPWAAAQALPTATRGRQLAPDALNIIPPGHEHGDTYLGPLDLPYVATHPEIAWDPYYAPVSETLYERGKNVVFRNDVYCLEYAFKPVRMISVELPTPEGYRNKNVWYLLYRVRYLGRDYQPVREEDPFDNEVYTNQSVSSEWVRFFPYFTLEAKGLDRRYGESFHVAAKRAIAAKERVGAPIYDSIEMQKLKIERSTETEDHPVWGVATWIDVDPRTDFFTVEVRGLANAQRVESGDGPDLDYLQKTLVLFFSRPGDTINELRDQIRYGIPALADAERQQYVLDQYGVTERLDYMWVYR